MHKTLRKANSTTKLWEKMIEKARVDDLIEPGSVKERLNAVFLPAAPREAIRFFNFMQTHISLASNGMGVGLRESKEGLASLLEKEGYDYPIYENFIDSFENKLLKQYYDAQDKKKS